MPLTQNLMKANLILAKMAKGVMALNTSLLKIRTVIPIASQLKRISRSKLNFKHAKYDKQHKQ